MGAAGRAHPDRVAATAAAVAFAGPGGELSGWLGGGGCGAQGRAAGRRSDDRRENRPHRPPPRDGPAAGARLQEQYVVSKRCHKKYVLFFFSFPCFCQ